VLGGGVADVGERPGPGDDREHGDGGASASARRRTARAREPSARPGRPGGPSPAQVRPCAVTDVPGRGRPGERRVLHAWLPPERTVGPDPVGGNRAVGDEGAARPGRPGAELPSSTEIRFSRPFFISSPESGARGAGLAGCYESSMYLVCTFCVPGIYLRCTWGAFSPVRAVPGRRMAVVCVTVAPSRAAGTWRAGGACALHVGAVPALAGDIALAALARAEGRPTASAVCPAGPLPGERTLARVTARQAPGRRGNLRGRTRRPWAGRHPQARPPVCVGTAAKSADRSARYANQSPLRTIS
jgi:hypothetical protein